MKGGVIMRMKNALLLLAVLVSLSVTSAALADELLEGWTGDVFVGYNKATGNTQKASGNIAAQALKKFEHSQLQLKGNIIYSESNKEMDGQKWDALARYSSDFGADYKWYNFYQVYVDHDYFADIDYRVTPSVGLGYHIATTEDWVWDADAGIGYRITRYRLNTAADDEVLTAIVHTFMKKRVFEKAFLSEDLTVYPGLKSDSGVTVRSETVFSNPLQANLDLEIKYIIDYNSEPAAGMKKTDTQTIVGIKYKF
jgi:putative salt-induced outer membrane protein YdiY